MDTLPHDIEALQALVRQLLAENAALKTRIAELEARLQADSHNSHKPPSSDGFRKRPALPKPRGRKPGGQPGHLGKTLKMAAHPDRTVRCQPETCSCGASFHALPGTIIERRQVFDLPEPKLDVTEYQRVRCQCPACGRVHEGVFPSHVTAPAQYGAGVRAFAVLLNSGYLLPFKKIQGLFTDLFGYAVNEGTLVRANRTAYDTLASSEALLKAQLHDSPVCHFDETGLRVAGKLHWHHTVSNASVTYGFVHPKRGTEALNSPASLLPTYHGWAIHDCWASYFKYAACRHAL
jgi:transposase